MSLFGTCIFANSFHSGFAIRVIIRAVHRRFSFKQRSDGDRMVPESVHMTKQEQRVATDVPSVDAITPYDEAHFEMYVRILDASAAGADLGEIAARILGIDPGAEPERAIRAARSHLRRARWMTTHGYRHLLRP